MSTRTFSVRIAAGSRSIVEADSFPVAQNEITFLFGESGIGKSMICKAVYGLLYPDELDITINGNPYERHLANPNTREVFDSSFFVFQEPSTHLNPLMRVSEQLREGSLARAKHEKEILKRLWVGAGEGDVDEILDVYPKPYRPSGGEKQRFLLAMAFKKIELHIKNKGEEQDTLFVFDEPTGSLDDNYRNVFLKSLFELYAQRPFSIIVITHDYSMISEIYGYHKELVPRIHFKELRRIDGARVEAADFSAEEYLGWLRETRPAAPAASRGKAVLTVQPCMRIFDRELTIYADRKKSQAAPMTIHRGEMVYLKAPSGVGKTTVAKIVLGLYKPQQFAMTLGGDTVTEKTPERFWQKKVWGKRGGMVFQHADESLNLEATVRETFDALPLAKRMRTPELKQRLGELFEESQLTNAFLRKKVKYLSGGQKQRLNLLRSMILGTDLIILDEPLNALDFGSVRKVLELLEEKRRQGTAIFMISHNEEIFDHIVGEEHTYYLAETG